MNHGNTIHTFIQPVFFTAVLLLVSSCSQNRQQNSTADKASDKIIPPQVTLLANLPDSNKPKEILLEDFPKPQTIAAKPPTTQLFIDPVTKEQIPPDAQGKGFFTNLTTEQGLPQETVNALIQDSKGNLWFALGPGACRYDGKSFTLFSTTHGMSANSVNCVMEDKEGNLWFGTIAGGVSKYDGKTFVNYSTSQGLAFNDVSGIFQDRKGIMWFSTMGGGICRYDGKKFTNYTTRNGLPSDETFCITEDSRGDIWIGTNGGGVSRYDGKSFTNYTTADGLAHNNVFHILADRSGQLWFSTIGGGASRFDGNKFTNYTTAEGLAHNIVVNIREDKAGNLWFGTGGGGISRFDGKSFTNFNTTNGLAHDIVLSITEDRSGNMWFGTSGGVSCYKGKSFTNFSSAEGREMSVVFGILKDKKGNLWFGTTEGGFSCYTGKGLINYNTGFNHAAVYDFHEDSMGNIWLGTERGLCRFDGKNFSSYTNQQGLPYVVHKITKDNYGNLWIGSNSGGASCFSGKSFTNYTTAQGLVDNLVRTVTKDKKGNLWFGTAGGLSKYDGKSFTNYTTAQGLANNFVINVTEDSEGNLWIGTEGGGLSRYDGKTFHNLTTSQGLPDNVVTSIVIDSNNSVVIGTNYGFGVLNSFKPDPAVNKSANDIPPQNHLSNEELKKFIPQIEIYNSSTGYPVKDVNYGQNAMLRDDKGILWIGTGGDKTGLVRFDQKAVRKSSSAPVIVLQKIKINNENICWNNLLEFMPDSNRISPNIPEEATTLGRILNETERDSMRMKFGDIKFDSISRFYPIPGNLVLPYRHNNIGFDFAAIETVRPFLVKYQYILEGYDKEWNPVTKQSSAGYGNIQEGTYTFKLKAQSPDGVWSEPLLYKFKVLPPWWRTWWFRTLMGIVFILLFYGIYRWRTAALRQQKRKLEQTVKERTAEVVEEKAEVVRQKDVIQKEKNKSDELLLNILPSEVAEELKDKGYTTAKSFDEVTVLFSDIKGFTNVAEKMTAQELVKEINTYFSAFDGIIQKYGLEKIKTIGDAYIAAGGLPEKNAATAQNVVEAAIAMQQTVEELKQERVSSGNPYFELRIGIHTGPVVAGVVGVKKFQYDIWGDTVNLAARMEQSGVPCKINISQHTYELVKEQFTCVHRGKIDAKNKGEIDMYFVE